MVGKKILWLNIHAWLWELLWLKKIYHRNSLISCTWLPFEDSYDFKDFHCGGFSDFAYLSVLEKFYELKDYVARYFTISHTRLFPRGFMISWIFMMSCFSMGFHECQVSWNFPCGLWVFFCNFTDNGNFRFSRKCIVFLKTLEDAWSRILVQGKFDFCVLCFVLGLTLSFALLWFAHGNFKSLIIALVMLVFFNTKLKLWVSSIIISF